MLLNEIIPHPSIAEYVRLFRVIHFVFPETTNIPAKAYTPRPEHCLQFFPAGKNRITYTGSDKIITTKNAIFSGQHNVINNRQMENNFLSVQVIFQPGALHRWLGIPSVQLTNMLVDAEDILGNKIALINEKLCYAKTYDEMIQLIGSFLLEEFSKIKKDNHPVNAICKLMLKEEDRSLDWFVKQAYLSHRQFDRKFYDSTGVNPKDFLKIIRFDKAYRMKNRFPEKDWLSIALHCGYYDYAHLSKAYQLFTGHTPPEFFKIDTMAPERLLGIAET
ncbi:helix-turn-helix domain-containing protein [Ferruginibacter sp. SUN106]|uniref:helix-turn-helix domain-containing protein n=1 Tax=Ferruginibacter sp. SUN106 TaxID=2978348 RepID=UPI003D36E88B